MDAAILVISTIDDDSEGPAHLMYKVGNHLVEDMRWVFGTKSSTDPIVERDEYTVAVDRLLKAGYQIKDREAGWKRFVELRSNYADTLNSIAHWLVIPPAQWIGDRSYLPHRTRARRRKR
jgi:hypothetical protein